MIDRAPQGIVFGGPEQISDVDGKILIDLELHQRTPLMPTAERCAPRQLAGLLQGGVDVFVADRWIASQ